MHKMEWEIAIGATPYTTFSLQKEMYAYLSDNALPLFVSANALIF